MNPSTPGGGVGEHSGESTGGALRRAPLVFSVLALLISIYLTIEHYTNPAALVCVGGGRVDCVAVTTSPWSTFLGIPVALLGLVFFVALTAACLPAVYARRSRVVSLVRFALAVMGLGFVFYLIWAELFRIGLICSWCTAVHVLTAAIFICLLVSVARDGFVD